MTFRLYVPSPPPSPLPANFLCLELFYNFFIPFFVVVFFLAYSSTDKIAMGVAPLTFPWIRNFIELSSSLG